MSQQKLSQELISAKLPALQLVLGGIPQTRNDEFIPTADALISRTISETEKAFIANNNIWQYGKVYNEWDINVTSNYYVYNPENRIVYLCTDNKPNNRIDEEAAVSTVIPAETTSGVFKTDDGYSWCPLFKVDISQLDFLSSRDLPLPDLNPPKDYSTVESQYELFCGSSGVTSYGCCCLYYKEDSINDITGQIYTSGSLSGETIFNECFECQKLADTLGREATFLSGFTAGSITGATGGPNSLCPSTKTIKTLQDQLTEDQYTLVPGGSREFALSMLDNFANDSGIMAIRIDLSALTTTQRTITSTTSTPAVTIIDPSGTEATARLITEVVGTDTYLVIGIELLTSGSGYSEVPDISTGYTNIDNAIQVVRFPAEFYSDPTQLVPKARLRIKASVPSYVIDSSVETEEITKVAVLINPKKFGTASPLVSAPLDTTVRNLQTKVFVGKDGATIFGGVE